MNGGAQRPQSRRQRLLLCGISSLLAAMAAAQPTQISPTNGAAGPAARPTDRRQLRPEEKAPPSFPPGCTWECYLENYPDLANHLPHTEEAALNHWENVGIKKWSDCTCKEGGSTAPDQGADAVGEVKITEEVTKEVTEDVDAAFPPGCSWECYRANYIHPSKRTTYDTEEKVLSHYLHHGIKEGQDCTCKDDAAIADKLLDQIEEIEEQLAELNFQDDDSIKSKVEKEKKVLEEEDEMIRNSIPSGCSWECFLADYMFVWMIVIIAPLIYVVTRRQRYTSFQKPAIEERREEPSEELSKVREIV